MEDFKKEIPAIISSLGAGTIATKALMVDIPLMKYELLIVVVAAVLAVIAFFVGKKKKWGGITMAITVIALTLLITRSHLPVSTTLSNEWVTKAGLVAILIGNYFQ